MGTQQDHDEYMLAYGECRSATDAFEALIRTALRGGHVDPTQAALDASSLKRLHARWLEKSLPLTTFRRA